ncbi:hypothetical protein V6N13_100521 [Hibiscus sabdariffa]
MGSDEEEIGPGNNEKLLEEENRVGPQDKEESLAQINSNEIRAREDTILMGFKKGELTQQNILDGESDEDISGGQIKESNDDLTWAEKVDMLNSLQPTQENKALSTAERKKRDHAQRRNKENWVDRELSYLEGRSLSDSDIRTRQNAMIREAQKTLKVGKEVGIKFKRPEQDVIREISLLEEAELNAKEF